VEKRLTIHDIARLAGVSVATVSRILNGNPKVDQKLVERVREVIRKTGYTPRQVAQAFSHGNSRTVALLCEIQPSHMVASENIAGTPPALRSSAYVADSHIVGLVIGINDVLLQKNYHLKLINVPARMHHQPYEEVATWLKPILDPPNSSGVILLNPTEQDTILECLSDAHLPCLLIGRSSTTKDVPMLDVDNIDGARVATAHLIQQGHSRIAFLAPDADLTFISDRKEGFQQAFEEAGISLPENWWLPIPIDDDSLFPFVKGRAYIESALRENFPFTAMVTFNDEMAFGAIQALTARGWRVPEDISIVGFDDLPAARMYSPPLTTVRQNIRYVGQYAARLLLRCIDGNVVPSLTILPTELVVRESTRPLNT
jgi:LacI family transcriptional regulator